MFIDHKLCGMLVSKLYVQAKSYGNKDLVHFPVQLPQSGNLNILFLNLCRILENLHCPSLQWYSLKP